MLLRLNESLLSNLYFVLNRLGSYFLPWQKSMQNNRNIEIRENNIAEAIFEMVNNKILYYDCNDLQ